MDISSFRRSTNIEDDRGSNWQADPLNWWTPGIGSFQLQQAPDNYPTSGPTLNAAFGAGLPTAVPGYSVFSGFRRIPFQEALGKKLAQSNPPQWLLLSGGAPPGLWSGQPEVVSTDDPYNPGGGQWQ